tara:strand:- start:1712 stop:2821 length:1110 start_codon:yes stop_codon:yes gene_type:complete
MAIKKMKKTKSLPRARARTGIGAAPDTNFTHFNDYIRMEVDKKDVASFIKTYIKQTFDKDKQRVYLAAPEWAFTPKHFIASTILWEQKGKAFPDNWNAKSALDTFFAYLEEMGNKYLYAKTEEVVSKPRKTPTEIIQEKTSDFIGGIEITLDEWTEKSTHTVYVDLIKDAFPQSTASAVVSFYTPLRNELTELISKKTPDLVEAYSSQPLSVWKKYLAFVQSIIDDADKYVAAKKATRTPRKPRVKSADKQVVKIQICSENKEYKLKSIHPMSIVGAMRLYCFNIKTKKLIEYVSHKATGFEVKGTSLKGWDADLSRQITLRKPNDVLPVALSKTPNQIGKAWSALTTNTTAPNGRLNRDTIILRAMSK